MWKIERRWINVAEKNIRLWTAIAEDRKKEMWNVEEKMDPRGRGYKTFGLSILDRNRRRQKEKKLVIHGGET